MNKVKNRNRLLVLVVALFFMTSAVFLCGSLFFIQGNMDGISARSRDGVSARQYFDLGDFSVSTSADVVGSAVTYKPNFCQYDFDCFGSTSLGHVSQNRVPFVQQNYLNFTYTSRSYSGYNYDYLLIARSPSYAFSCSYYQDPSRKYSNGLSPLAFSGALENMGINSLTSDSILTLVPFSTSLSSTSYCPVLYHYSTPLSGFSSGAGAYTVPCFYSNGFGVYPNVNPAFLLPFLTVGYSYDLSDFNDVFISHMTVTYAIHNYGGTYDSYNYRTLSSTADGIIPLNRLNTGYNSTTLFPLFNNTSLLSTSRCMQVIYTYYFGSSSNSNYFPLFSVIGFKHAPGFETYGAVNGQNAYQYTLYNLNTRNNPNYTTGYNAGYTAGFNQGYNNGNFDGWVKGNNDGYSTGYDVGFSAGAESAHTYTFFSLLSAVFDAPVQALTGLLNFNVLGFNMLNFLLSLFTLAIIISIIKVFV